MKSFLRNFKFFILTGVLLSAAYASNSQTTIPQYTFNNLTIGCNSIPFGTTATWGPYRSQFLYPPGDFPTLTTPGFITTIYFQSCGNLAINLDNLEIYIGNTTVTNLTGYVTGLTLARPASNFTHPLTGNNQWWAIPLSTPVYIQPNQSIVVDIQKTGGTGPATWADGAPLNPLYAANMTHAFSATTSGAVSVRNYSYAFGFDLFAGFPCTDTPKTSVNGPKKVCPRKPFTLRPDSFYSDADYKWEYSNNGIAWSNFTGVPGLYGEIKDSLIDSRWYRLTVKCKNNNNLVWTTPVHRVDIAPFYYCYCDNQVTADAGADIGNVTIINTNKFDTVYGKRALATGTGLPVFSNSGANKKYTAYHDSLGWPCLYRDTNYIFNVTQIHSAATFEIGVLQAYIDYNRDGLYNPVTERVFVKALDGTGTTPHIAQLPITIPSTARIGATGLRIIISKDTVKAAPCDTISGGGEVEDYIIEICHRPCDAAVNAGMVVSTDTSMCNGYEYTLTDTTYEKARSGFSRSWQISGDNMTWQNINNSTGKDTLERIFGGQPLHYRLRTICLPTHDTNYSQSTLINVKPGYKCYCYSKAIGGKNVDTSDIGGVSIAAYSNNAGGPHLLNPVAMYPRTDYTDIDPIEVYTDSTYRFYVYHTMPVAEHGDAKVTIFMDFNNNHEYDIPEERIYTGFTTIGNHTLVDNVEVPTNAITDVPTGMRVIVNNNVGPNIPSDEACGSYTSGETEDYLLVFRKKWGVNVKDILSLNNFMVHPNPTTGRFTVQFNSQSEVNQVSIRVTTVTGQLVQEQSYSHKGGVFYKELNIANQPAGVYLVELNADGEKMMKKLVLQ